MVAVKGCLVQVLGKEYVGGQGVLDRHDRAEPVESAEDDMGDRRVGRQLRFDDQSEEVRERDPLPAQVGGRPPGTSGSRR